MSTEAALFPIYQLMDAFEAFSHGEPNVKPQHRSLYYFLVAYARKRGNVPRFTLPYEVGMHGSSIGSWTTYDATVKALAAWGFIVYTPGANRYKVPVVELTFRGSEEDELMSYWQAYCLAYPIELQKCNPSPIVELQNPSPSQVVELQNCIPTSNSTDNSTGDIKKTIRHKTNDNAATAADADSSSQKKAGDQNPASKPAADPGPVFQEFWDAYGKKEDTKKCKLRWQALHPEQRRAALAAVPTYVAAKPDRRYRKNPLTWLNGECWQDEAPAYSQPTASPAPNPVPTVPAGPPLVLQEEINHDFENTRLAREEAERQAETARFRARHAGSSATADGTHTP